MLESKPLMVAGCIAAVVGGTAFGWVVAGTPWQMGLPQTMMTSYAAPAAVADKPAPAVAPAPAAKVEEPAPADTPEATAPPDEKKAQPKGRMEPTRAAAPEGRKRKSPAGALDPEVVADAVGGKARLKMPDVDVDVGTVHRYAKRYLDMAVDLDD